MKNGSVGRRNDIMWSIRSLPVVVMALLTVSLVACWVTEPEEREGAADRSWNRCQEWVNSGESEAAFDCLENHYARYYPSISGDMRELVIGKYIDCLQAAEDADARDRCDRDRVRLSEATREAVSLVASVEAYDTRVAQEAAEATAVHVDEATSALPSEENIQEEDEDGALANASVPAGRYVGVNLDVPPDWVLVESEFVIDVAEDGTVLGSRVFVIEMDVVGATCTTHRENGHHTVISGQLLGPTGYVKIENDSYTISDSSDCGGANNHKTYELVCDREQISVSGGQMEISPISGGGNSDCGFVFTATKE